MRKSLAIILAAVMMLSLAIVGVSAADPVPVSSAADFAAMDPAGSYKLTADITVEAAYGNGETIVPFTGTFDGGGFTVTLKDTPLFVRLHDATVQNLKLAGTAKGDRDLGALAIEGYGFTVKNVTNNANVIGPAEPTENSWIGGFVGEVYATSGHGTAEQSCPTLFENCVNNGNVDMSHSSKDARAGGFVGNAAKYQRVTYKNCTNNGNVTYTGTKTNAYLGGFVGGCFGNDFINCKNTGKITASKASSVGGLLGRGTPSSQNGDQSSTFTNCENTGDITNTGTSAAGIAAYVNDASGTTTQTYKFISCTNTGKVTNTGSHAAGILAYMGTHTLLIEDCVNKGDVSNESGNAGGILGRFGGDYAKAKEYTCTIKNCLNKGNVTGGTTTGGIAGFARSCTMYINNCTNDGDVKAAGDDAGGILSSSNVTTVSDVKNVGNSDIRIDKCVNNGSVTSEKGRGAGICGYVWAGGGAESVVTSAEVTNCVNYGAIKGTTYVSQIMSYTNKKENVIKNNVGLGSVAATTADATPKLAFYAFSSAQLPPELKDNIIVADGTEYATWTTETGKEGKDQSRTIPIGGSTEKVDGDTTIVFKADDYVTVKTEAEAKAAVAALGEIGYKDPSAPSNPGTTDPGGSTVITGDTAVIVMIVCLVSLLGMGIALKARRA